MVAEADVAVLVPVCGAKHEVIDNNVVAYSSHVESRGVIVNLKVKLPTGTKNLERLGRNIYTIGSTCPNKPGSPFLSSAIP
jgi:hypothetical protein